MNNEKFQQAVRLISPVIFVTAHAGLYSVKILELQDESSKLSLAGLYLGKRYSSVTPIIRNVALGHEFV